MCCTQQGQGGRTWDNNTLSFIVRACHTPAGAGLALENLAQTPLFCPDLCYRQLLSCGMCRCEVSAVCRMCPTQQEQGPGTGIRTLTLPGACSSQPAQSGLCQESLREKKRRSLEHDRTVERRQTVLLHPNPTLRYARQVPSASEGMPFAPNPQLWFFQLLLFQQLRKGIPPWAWVLLGGVLVIKVICATPRQELPPPQKQQGGS